MRNFRLLMPQKYRTFHDQIKYNNQSNLRHKLFPSTDVLHSQNHQRSDDQYKKH